MGREEGWHGMIISLDNFGEDLCLSAKSPHLRCCIFLIVVTLQHITHIPGRKTIYSNITLMWRESRFSDCFTVFQRACPPEMGQEALSVQDSVWVRFMPLGHREQGC